MPWQQVNDGYKCGTALLYAEVVLHFKCVLLAGTGGLQEKCQIE